MYASSASAVGVIPLGPFDFFESKCRRPHTDPVKSEAHLGFSPVPIHLPETSSDMPYSLPGLDTDGIGSFNTHVECVAFVKGVEARGRI
jgi:hypothetical protein